MPSVAIKTYVDRKILVPEYLRELFFNNLINNKNLVMIKRRYEGLNGFKLMLRQISLCDSILMD